MDPFTGRLKVDSHLVAMSRRWCCNQLAELMRAGTKSICVVDLSPRLSEWQEYVDMAREAGYHLVVLDKPPQGYRRFTPYRGLHAKRRYAEPKGRG